MKKLITVFCIMLLAVFTFVLVVVQRKVRKNKLKKFVSAKLPTPLFYAPLYVGIEQGFFKDEGLNIDLQNNSWRR